jgi:hypothetical protein
MKPDEEPAKRGFRKTEVDSQEPTGKVSLIGSSPQRVGSARKVWINMDFGSIEAQWVTSIK